MYIIPIAKKPHIFRPEGTALAPPDRKRICENQNHHCCDADQKANVNQGASDPLNSSAR